MSRGREYRITMRENKIKSRRDNILNFGFYVMSKRNAMVTGDKSGYLNKCHYGGLGRGIKTKTKNSYASYRHKGGFGKALLHSRHDKRQIIRMEQEINEYNDKK